MSADNLAEILKDIEEASNLTHRWRAMRVTLECGHLRLTPKINTIMGIGAYTRCRICAANGKDSAERQIVNVEETGVLHNDFFEWKAKSNG